MENKIFYLIFANLLFLQTFYGSEYTRNVVTGHNESEFTYFVAFNEEGNVTIDNPYLTCLNQITHKDYNEREIVFIKSCFNPRGKCLSKNPGLREQLNNTAEKIHSCLLYKCRIYEIKKEINNKEDRDEKSCNRFMNYFEQCFRELKLGKIGAHEYLYFYFQGKENNKK